ncbi:phosphoribosyl-AMP cyclohydrolase [Pseudofrancisella aestuarii]|uniref:Phosphoribosyl-AMP cyclohydrolase n=1 Tax=Pseudofrancisella aestuarii TaxID=2670347 RepID=A0ABV9TBJ9_9GAMM|nr:phosphoribosyl-AMP cyclohydrolase [Pseudofrancisella aestuarii]
MTRNDIDNALNQWKEGLLEIAKLNKEGKAYEAMAKAFINDMYAYDNHEVLFKPTLASKKMFRDTLDGAVSYFIGNNLNFPEDNGFALNDWIELEFENTGYILDENIGIVMGNKHLTKSNGEKVVANYTMGFKRNSEGDLQIVLHHSSLPFVPV